jgi:hypothetical protein
MTGSTNLRGRQALLAVALAAMLVTAGCTGVLDGDGDSSGSSGPQLDAVPDDASMVGYVDVAGMASDESLRELANAAFQAQDENSEYYQGPTSVDEMLRQAENESDLDPNKVVDMTFFGTEGENVPTNAEQAGAILNTEFTEDELTAAMEDEGTEFETETHQDTTVYTYGYENQNALAALGDGTFAVGDTEAVYSVLDVDAGDQNALSGEVRSQFESTDDGYLRFAADIPQDQVPTDQIGQDAPVDTSAFNTVQYVSGSMSTSSDSVTTQVNLVSESSDDAARVGDVVDGALSLYSGVGNDDIRETIEAVEVEQNDDTVTVSFSETVDVLKDRIELLYSMNAGASASASGSDTASDGSASVTGASVDAGSALAV